MFFEAKQLIEGKEKKGSQPPMGTWNAQREANIGLAKIHDTETVICLDKEKLKKLKEIFDIEKDCDFRDALLQNWSNLLPKIFEKMKNKPQTPPHYGKDPLEHTLSALLILETSAIEKNDRPITRAAVFWHDIGKAEDSFDRDHPAISADLAEENLLAMGYSPEETQRILLHIRWHDALGEIARRDGQNFLFPRDLSRIFPSRCELAVHRAVAEADVKSIPGLKKNWLEIQAVYESLDRRIANGENFIIVPENSPLPFVFLDSNQIKEATENFSDCCQKAFDFVKIFSDASSRTPNYFFNFIDKEIGLSNFLAEKRRLFEKLPEETQGLCEMLMIQKSLKIDELQDEQNFLNDLLTMGRAEDRGFVLALEKKYNCRLDHLRIGVEMFILTFNLWRLNNYLVETTSPNLDFLTKILKEVRKSADFLSSFKICATHSSDSCGSEKIDEHGDLHPSRTSEKKRDFEGDGVYTGILGDYRSWNPEEEGGKVYKFWVPLADTLPILVSFYSPGAMANILCEALSIRKGQEETAVAFGLTQWRQSEFDHDPLEKWKLDLLEKELGEVYVIDDDEGKKTVIVDTDEEPIIWAAIARALRIRRLIPLSELNKSGLSLTKDCYSGKILTKDKDEDIIEIIRRAKPLDDESF